MSDLQAGDRVVVIDLDESWTVWRPLCGMVGTVLSEGRSYESVWVEFDGPPTSLADSKNWTLLRRILRKLHPLEDLARAVA